MSEKPPEEKAASEEDFLAALLNQNEPSALDETVASLEAGRENINNKLLEERFVWILVCMILADAYIFSHMDNWAGALVIGILEVVAVVIMADRCEVDTVAPLIDKITGFVSKAARKDDDNT